VAKVHRAPWWGALLGAAALTAAAAAVPLSPAGWAVGLLVSLVTAFLVALGVRRRRMSRFGPANAVTTVRAGLVGVAAAYAATSLTQAVPPAVLVAVVVPAIALDGVDGWVARRARCVTELGARYDMEVDAFLLLVLGVPAGPRVGWWVLAIGLMRYAYVVAGWALPWLRATLPPRYWRKVVTAACGTALIAAASGLLPTPAASATVLGALVLLGESFGRDVLWLARRRFGAAARPVHDLEPVAAEVPAEP
jgi:phosphatidylglycerophosphate synthase